MRAPIRSARPASNPGRRNQFGESDYPWNAPYVREDVVKGYALRLPEPLYLKLKWVAGQTGQSVNALCREAVEAEVERRLRDVGGG